MNQEERQKKKVIRERRKMRDENVERALPWRVKFRLERRDVKFQCMYDKRCNMYRRAINVGREKKSCPSLTKRLC